MPKVLSLPDIGDTFGKLTVESLRARRHNGRTVIWCRCFCGKTKRVKPSDLKRGFVTSCGCAKTEVLIKRNKAMATHGMSRSPEHRAWRGMRERCQNPQNKYYHRYGGRGIKVCKRWSRFENFYADMGSRPSRRFTLERLNNNGPYSPKNCVWATRKQQNNNKRSSRRLRFENQTKTVTQWAECKGINIGTLFSRLRAGMSVKDALSIRNLKAQPRSSMKLRLHKIRVSAGKAAAAKRWGYQKSGLRRRV